MSSQQAKRPGQESEALRAPGRRTVSVPNMPEYLRRDEVVLHARVSLAVSLAQITQRCSDVAVCACIPVIRMHPHNYIPAYLNARSYPLYDRPPVSAELKAHSPLEDEGVARKQPVVLSVHYHVWGGGNSWCSRCGGGRETGWYWRKQCTLAVVCVRTWEPVH